MNGKTVKRLRKIIRATRPDKPWVAYQEAVHPKKYIIYEKDENGNTQPKVMQKTTKVLDKECQKYAYKRSKAFLKGVRQGRLA